MITARLEGGLGNQMWQIATTYALALDNNDECGFDFYERKREERKHYVSGKSPSLYTSTVYNKLKELPEGWESESTYMDTPEYTPIPYSPNMMLGGYLCYPEYFTHRRKEVLDLFKNKELIKNVGGRFKNSLAIHVRRGDYYRYEAILPIEYYRKALAYIDSKTQVDVIYVFTENLREAYRWVRKNFKGKRVVFETGNADYMDLYKMSLCEHNIIANSSFSWWGSYLNENENKIVCSPDIWFKNSNPSPTAFFCKDWVLIDY